MKIGFIGLGIMGKPMCINLLRAGYEVKVSGHNAKAAEELTHEGAQVAATPKEIAAQVDLIITMLPNSPQVQEVALGTNGIVEGAHDGLTYVDMSSIAPLASREVHDALAKVGVPMLEAPVSGGEPKAVDGTLSIMVGGDGEVYDTVHDVLAVLGSAVVHVGEIGSGNTAKLANQVVVALNIAAVSEALMLARMAQVDPESVFEAIRGGLAGSTVLEAKAPMILDRDFTPGFRIDLHVKDLLNALETGGAVDAPLPLTEAVLDMLRTLQTDGHGGDDHSGLVQYYEKLSHTRVERTA
jgi:2-hydroxy-3-oxopropionate reductase